MNNTSDSRAKTPDDRMDQGGNYWTLFPPESGKFCTLFYMLAFAGLWERWHDPAMIIAVPIASLADWILEPCLHGSKAMAPFVDTVRENSNMLTVDASRRRMELADKANALELGLDAAATIQARNSLEKMLVHQMSAAHVAAMEMQAEAREMLRTYKRTGYVHQHLSIEAGRLFNASARMMSAYQGGMLTIEKVRSGGQQTMVIQHVNVGDGGQAVVAGQVKAGAKRRKKGATSGGDPKSSDNPMRPAPWSVPLALAQSCPRCAARTRSGHSCRSAAMPNGRCRMHGGGSLGAPQGQALGMWRHGLRSAGVVERRRRMTALMRTIREAYDQLADGSVRSSV